MWKCLLFVGTCIVYMYITSDRKYSLRNDNSIFKITQESPTLIHGNGWNIEYLSIVTGTFANNVIQAQLHWFSFEIWFNQSWFVVLISHLESNMEQHEITWNWQSFIMYNFILHCLHFHKMRKKNITSPEQFQRPTENIRCKDKTNSEYN
jgi:hypothetical protein